VGIDAAGTATAAWSRGVTPIVQFATKTNAAASWPPVTLPGANDLSASGAGAAPPGIVVAPDGTTTVAWVRSGVVQERTRPAIGGAFASVTTIPSTSPSAATPVLKRGGDGSTSAVWSATNADPAPKDILGAARRAAGDTTFAALPTGPGTGNTLPAAAADDQGNLTVGWLHTAAGPQYAVQVTGLDLVGPLVSGLTFPSSAAAGTAFSYGATLSDRWTTPTGTWAFGDGTTGQQSGTKSYAAGGSFAAQLVASDGAANTTIVDRTIDVVGPGGPGGGPAGPTAPAGPGGPTPGGSTPDAIAPVLSAASLTRTTFAVDPKGASVAVAKRGTTIRYTLSEAATVRFTVERRLTGRRVGGRCRATAPSNRRRPACTRFVAAGTFSQSSPTGRTTKRFAGRIAKRSLRVARYRLTLVATDAAGNRSAARRLTFRVVRR